MNSCELATYVTAIACFISESFPEEELPLICTMLTQLNDTLKTILAQELLCNKRAEKAAQKEEKDNNKEASEDLKKEMAEVIKKELSEIFSREIAVVLKKDAEE